MNYSSQHNFLTLRRLTNPRVWRLLSRARAEEAGWHDSKTRSVGLQPRGGAFLFPPPAWSMHVVWEKSIWHVFLCFWSVHVAWEPENRIKGAMLPWTKPLLCSGKNQTPSFLCVCPTCTSLSWPTCCPSLHHPCVILLLKQPCALLCVAHQNVGDAILLLSLFVQVITDV
jgi:hypothetical protein